MIAGNAGYPQAIDAISGNGDGAPLEYHLQYIEAAQKVIDCGFALGLKVLEVRAVCLLNETQPFAWIFFALLNRPSTILGQNMGKNSERISEQRRCAPGPRE